MDYIIYDFEGLERDSEWLNSYFGDVSVSGAANKSFAVSELVAVRGPASIVVTVVDADGVGINGIKVAFYWPDAPRDPSAGWYNRCVVGETNAEGCVGFGIGGGAYYSPPNGGPHAVWIYGDGMSEKVDGLGMVAGTNHDHINVTFARYATPSERYFLDVSAVYGYIAATPQQPDGGYISGTHVQVVAVPDGGYHLVGWTGDVDIGPQNPIDVVMDSDKSVTAIFEEDSVSPPSGHVRFYDVDGNRRGAAWAEYYFGEQDIYSPPVDKLWRISELVEENSEGSPWNVLSVVLVDGDGNPMPGETVGVGPITTHGDVLREITDEFGVARFAMGDSFVYSVPGKGKYGVAVESGDSEVYKSVGMVSAIPQRWLNVVFMMHDDPEFPSGELAMIIDNIDGMIDSGREFLENIANIRAILNSLLD